MKQTKLAGGDAGKQATRTSLRNDSETLAVIDKLAETCQVSRDTILQAITFHGINGVIQSLTDAWTAPGTDAGKLANANQTLSLLQQEFDSLGLGWTAPSLPSPFRPEKKTARNQQLGRPAASSGKDIQPKAG